MIVNPENQAAAPVIGDSQQMGITKLLASHLPTSNCLFPSSKEKVLLVFRQNTDTVWERKDDS